MTKNVSYYHYGILIIAQGSWRSKDKEFVNQNIIYLKVDNLYKKTFPDNCEICSQVHSLFNELTGSQSVIEYICNLLLEKESILKLMSYLKTENLVKKVLFFQGGPVTKKKEKIIIKERLSNKIIQFNDFIKLIQDGLFNEEILYEIRKY